ALLAEVSSGHPKLENRDFDTGNPTRPGEYVLADKTYSRLLDRLARNNFAAVTPELDQNIMAFYADPSAPNAVKRDKAQWQKTLRQLDDLRSRSTSVPAAH